MGIPAFFRWLVDRFPKVVVDVIEEKLEEEVIQEISVPIDTSKPNPNNIEFDNLYLDMNGIIHPCCHPHDKPPPPTEEHMLIEIGKYLDRLFAIVRPRKLLYMAIDGVAPRAKMNQQRSRRFRAAREAKQKKEVQDKIKEDLLSRGQSVPEEDNDTQAIIFDSNCITPGTPFMAKVADYLNYYVALHISSDPGWKGLKVIISDSNVPGEGEHKLMEYIRQQRSSQFYEPNTRHCIYGLDADLIMLSLATHEPHFSVLREIVTVNKNNCFRCNQPGHLASECTGQKQDSNSPVLFQFLHVNVLREYLNYMLFIPDLPFEYDLERVIDDWVFLCFFVGNDFLPHLPTLEIRENAIGLLTNLYKQLLPTTGYLTKSGEIYAERVEVLLGEVAHLEDSILRNRLVRINRANSRNEQNKNKRERPVIDDTQNDNYKKNMDAAAALRASLMGAPSPEISHPTKKAKSDEGPILSTSNNSKDTIPEKQVPPDEVRLGEAGWKERYYQHKFHTEMNNVTFFQKLRTEYLRGLAWVLKYYYSGCPSWEWYFPFHYAPFASEMIKLGEVDLNFDLGAPFKPLEQLMAVLPPASALHVPEKYRALMTNPASPINEFYPVDFEIDLNGKTQEWQGVALLPFIDEKQLRKAISPLEVTLTEEEKRRNTTRPDLLFVHHTHVIASQLKQTQGKDVSVWFALDAEQLAGFSGFVACFKDSINPGQLFPSPIPEMLSPVDNHSLSTHYKVNCAAEVLRGLLNGVTLPLPTLTSEDLAGPPRRTEGYHRNQNSASNRMINNSLGTSNQYKMNYNQQRPHYQNTPYSRPNDRNYSTQERNYQARDHSGNQQRSYQDDRRPHYQNTPYSRPNNRNYNTQERNYQGRTNNNNAPQNWQHQQPQSHQQYQQQHPNPQYQQPHPQYQSQTRAQPPPSLYGQQQQSFPK